MATAFEKALIKSLKDFRKILKKNPDKIVVSDQIIVPKTKLHKSK